MPELRVDSRAERARKPMARGLGRTVGRTIHLRADASVDKKMRPYFLSAPRN